jgi:hypothetical protein
MADGSQMAGSHLCHPGLDTSSLGEDPRGSLAEVASAAVTSQSSSEYCKLWLYDQETVKTTQYWLDLNLSYCLYSPP